MWARCSSRRRREKRITTSRTGESLSLLTLLVFPIGDGLLVILGLFEIASFSGLLGESRPPSSVFRFEFPDSVRARNHLHPASGTPDIPAEPAFSAATMRLHMPVAREDRAETAAADRARDFNALGIIGHGTNHIFVNQVVGDRGRHFYRHPPGLGRPADARRRADRSPDDDPERTRVRGRVWRPVARVRSPVRSLAPDHSRAVWRWAIASPVCSRKRPNRGRHKADRMPLPNALGFARELDDAEAVACLRRLQFSAQRPTGTRP